MNNQAITSKSIDALRTEETVRDLIAAMPIVIFVKALRAALRGN